MNKYILFSAVGTTDPISNGYDGSILHICRKYLPEKVVLYLSKEMLELHRKDDRYRFSIKKLADMNNTEIEIEIIERENLVDVQKFDDFYDDFDEILKSITSSSSEKNILVNVSSGTPAMKSALNLIAGLSDGKILPVQVSTPEKKSNPKREDINAYDVEMEWECNIDNEGDYVDRTSLSDNMILISKVRKQIIRNHVEVYDYRAALDVAKGMENYLSADLITALEIACARLQLDRKRMDQISESIKDKEKRKLFDYIPVKQTDERTVFEFLLWLQVKQMRGDLADFIRGITPVLLDILEIMLRKKYRIDIKSYCDRRKSEGNYIYKLSRSKLENGGDTGMKMLSALDSEFGKGFEDSVYSSANLLPIISSLEEDRQFVGLLESMRYVERSARNLAAHEIESITEEWLKDKCSGMDSRSILNLLKKIVGRSGMNVSSKDWNSYDEMNDGIKVFLDQNPC